MSVERFLPTDAAGRLHKLIEEAIELALAGTKCGRFGAANRWPPEVGRNNADAIVAEFNDVLDAFEALYEDLQPFLTIPGRPQRPPAAPKPSERSETETLEELLARRHNEAEERRDRGRTFSAEIPQTPAASRVAGGPRGYGDPGFGDPRDKNEGGAS